MKKTNRIQLTTKKIILTVMAVFLLMFSACSLSGAQADVSGKYETRFMINRYLTEENIAFLEENGMGFVKDLEGRYELIIGEDTTFKISFDSEKLGEELFAGIDANADEIFTIVMERNQVAESEYEVFASRNGYGSVDELKEDMMTRMKNEVASKAGLIKLSEKNVSGNYTVKKDRITFKNIEEKYDHATIEENGDLLIESFFAKDDKAVFTKIP